MILTTACGKGSGGNVNAEVLPADAGLVTRVPGFDQNGPNKGATVEVTFSGETLGIAGLPFVPVTNGDPYFVDGWTLVINEFIVVVGSVRLNDDPTKDLTWSDVGQPAATKAGPFVFDAHQAHGFLGKDGVEPAQAMFVWKTKDDGSAFDTSLRYAFSYDTLPAVYPAWNLNLTAQGQQDYAKMVQNGWNKYVSATATYVGTGTYNNARDPNATHAQAQFGKFPTTVNFTFGWNDADSLLNCVNADLGDSADLKNRGVQIFPDKAAIAQITMHVDHLYWDILLHEGSPLRFDPIAAWAPMDTRATPFNLNKDFHSQHLATVFQDGTPIPDRGPFQPNAGPTVGGSQFATDQTNGGFQVIMNKNGNTSVPDDYIQFMAFSAQSQMHLNAQGLCYVVGQHPQDPFFTPTVH
jgi:hypothetical protein